MVSIDGRTPFETTTELAIPDEALHTGTSTQRERLTAESMPSQVPWRATKVRRTVETNVTWRVIVNGEIDGGVDFAHEFPIVVLTPSLED